MDVFSTQEMKTISNSMIVCITVIHIRMTYDVCIMDMREEFLELYIKILPEAR